MASYRLVFKQSVAKDLRSIPNEDVARILRRVDMLAADPRPAGSEKLSGVHRIIYAIDNKEMAVLVVKVGHRRDVHKNRVYHSLGGPQYAYSRNTGSTLHSQTGVGAKQVLWG